MTVSLCIINIFVDYDSDILDLRLFCFVKSVGSHKYVGQLGDPEDRTWNNNGLQHGTSWEKQSIQFRFNKHG